MQQNKSILSFLFPEDDKEKYTPDEIQGIVKNVKLKDLSDEDSSEDSYEEPIDKDENNFKNNEKSTSETETSNEDPLFPEKHYEKEAKKRYGDDIDPNLAEQMEKDEDFKRAMQKTAAHEGGYYNGKDDPGGETNHGISQKAYPNEDIKNMSKDRAEYIYYRDYYKNNNIDKLPDSVRDEVFDNSVNQGSTQAAKNLQRAVGAEPDGIIGPKTIDAVNNTDPEELKEKFKQNVLGVYDSIRINNPDNYNKHKNGWMNRTNSY